MKKIIFLALFFNCLAISLKSQTSDYFSLTSYVKNHTKENTQNRLIAVALWSAADKNSHDANAELNKAAYVFKNAKLKGGSNGIVGIIICLDNDEVTANIILKKEGITNLIAVNASELSSFPELSKKPSSYNAIFNSNGVMVFENLQSNSIFNSIHNLITR
jgi:hypothetical protein